MKTKCINIVICILAFFSCESCTNHVQQKSQVGECKDTIIIKEDSFILEEEYIESLIREDLKKRNWMAWIDTTSSPLFYKTIHDDNIIILYRVIPHGEKTCVAVINDYNIGVQNDYIEYDGTYGTDWVGYEHNGSYMIINDSTVNIDFETIWANYCAACDSSGQEFTYHIRCTHCYKLVGVAWERIKADTIIVIDERDHFCH